MMIYGLMKLKVTLLELSILKSDPFGQSILTVICHRNGSEIILLTNFVVSRWYLSFRFLSKVYCYAKKTGSSPENNSNWQCYSNGKWSPSNGVVTCSSSARSKLNKKSQAVIIYCSALKNDQQICCPLMTVKMPGQKWPLTLEKDHWSYQRDEWLRYFNRKN